MKKFDSDFYLEVIMTLPVGIFLIDDAHKICEWNNWLVTKTGVSRKDAMGQDLESLVPGICTSRFKFALEQVINQQHPQVLSQLLNSYLIPIPLTEDESDDEDEYMQQAVSLFPIANGDKTCALVTIIDVTESYQQRKIFLNAAKRFELNSIHDQLTGFYNRRYLWEYLESELSKSVREHFTIICTVFDLDHFKQVNDELGHKAGDEVLCSFASLVKKNTRSCDTVFRYGGEEFIIISTNVKLKDAALLGERIIKKMATKKQHGSIKRIVTCSAGFAVSVPLNPVEKPEFLVGMADEQLYKAKNSGRNKICGKSNVGEETDSEAIDLGILEKAVAGNIEMQEELLGAFVGELIEQKPLFVKAFSDEDAKLMKLLLHRLKSSAQTVGAISLSIASKEIERYAYAANIKSAVSFEADFFNIFYTTLKYAEDYLEKLREKLQMAKKKDSNS